MPGTRPRPPRRSRAGTAPRRRARARRCRDGGLEGEAGLPRYAQSMRSGRSWHVLLLALCARAAAQPQGPTVTENHDIPDWTVGPPKFAVTPFENHVVRGTALEWIVA